MAEHQLIEVANLSGPELDKWVAVALGYELAGTNGFIEGYCHIYRYPKGLNFGADSNVRPVPMKFTPSTDWNQGGPIIEREGIMIERCTPDAWRAHMSDTMNGYVYEAEEGFSFGETPLEAAMRCYVSSCKGETFTA